MAESDPEESALPPLNCGEQCEGCGLHPRFCLCARLELAIETRTRVIVLMHQKETARSSNTARLAEQALAGCEIRVHAQRGTRVRVDDLEDATRRVRVLFPDPDAEVLSQDWGAEGAPVTLVIPDGSWRQARRMARRVPIVRALPRVVLPPGPPSKYAQRKQSRPGHVSTFEAIARALGALEGIEVQRQLEALFREKVRNDLFLRGLQVRLPEGW